MRAALRAAGFAVIPSNNQTTLGIEWFEEQQARIAGKSHPVLWLHLVIGPEFPVMAANLAPQPEGRPRWTCPDDRGEGRPLSAVAPHPSVFELQ